MTSETKNRIAAINSGIIPEGYKKTKVGIVPVEWVEIPFGELIDEYKNKTIIENEDTLLSCAINGIFLNSELFSHQRGSSNKGYLKVDYGTLILSAQNLHLGNANVNLKFESGIVSPAYKTYRIKNCDVKYFSFWIKREETKRFFYNATTTGASQCRRNIEWDSLYEQIVVIPPLPEQQKIAEILSTQDKLIELQEKKIEQLKELKKAYLQKMFPQKGSQYPELRFKGFTAPWEQRELRTAATFSKGSGYSKNDLKENGTPIILYGRLYTKYETVINEVDTFVDVQPNSVYSTGHEVIVPASGETAEDISRASFVAKSGILLGGDLNIIVPDDYINPVFLALTISNGNQQKELSKRAQGKSVVHIHNSDLENVVLLYPSYEEQEKIGAYFSKLDSLITLHQRKSEQEKQKKKALMQLLLTGKVRCI